MIEKKVQQAIRLLQAVGSTNNDIELCYSGGKDSDVILTLAKMAGIQFTPIYKATTIDPPYTIAHARENGVNVVFPKKTFFQLLEKNAKPTRFSRWCCKYLKEYKIKDVAILGIRACESGARKKRYTEPTICRLYGKNEHVNQILPILFWSDADIEEFIVKYRVKLHPLYYREDGSIDVSRRLGCIGCPLRSDNGLAQFKQYPNFVKTYICKLQKYWDAHPNSKIHKYYTDVYEYFAVSVFVGGIGRAVLNKESIFKTDYKQRLEEYFGIKL